MPQMMPLNWLMLFFMFIIIFMMFITMNYYIYTPLLMNTKFKFNKIYNKLNWKW